MSAIVKNPATLTLDEKVKKAVEVIKHYHLTDSRPLYFAYSGGKDSTVLLALGVMALESLTEEEKKATEGKKIYTLFSDTLLEMPPVIGQIKSAIERFTEYSAQKGLPFVFQGVTPEIKNRFFSLLVGKGYSLPRTDYRWCTDRMKISPMNKAVDAVLEEFGGYIACTGARGEESQDRKARLERNAVEPGSPLKTHADSRCNMLCPIQDWTADDVWAFIYTKAGEWVDANSLGLIYSEAAGDGDECTSVLEGGEAGQRPGCSKSARFGCIICPLFDRDKTLGNLAEGHGYLRHAETFRNWLVQFRDGHWHDKRDVYNHRDHKRFEYNGNNLRLGMVSPGGYTLAFRMEILERLLETEALMKEEAPWYDFISDEELSYIQDCWVKEGDLNLNADKIAQKYGRSAKPSAAMAEILVSATLLAYGFASETTGDDPYAHLYCYTDSHLSSRYCSQLAMQLMKAKPGEHREWIKGLFGGSLYYEPYLAIRLVLEMPVETSQFHPTKSEEETIRSEWEKDEVNIVTFECLVEAGQVERPTMHLFGHEGERGERFDALDRSCEEGYDFTMDEELSLADQYAILEDCRIRDREARTLEMQQYLLLSDVLVA